MEQTTCIDNIFFNIYRIYYKRYCYLEEPVFLSKNTRKIILNTKIDLTKGVLR